VDRQSPEDYFAVALELLAEGGSAALTIANLCQRLGVTKGSFYHHFSGQPAFRDALLAHWEAQVDEVIAPQLEAVADPHERIELLKQMGVAVDHRAETALRAWARTDPVVAATQHRLDERREEQLALAFVELGIEPGHARVLARIGVTILVGTQQLEGDVDRARLGELFDEYQRWLEASARLPVAPRRGVSAPRRRSSGAGRARARPRS
jgi:AcrR family transcriptional regulator